MANFDSFGVSVGLLGTTSGAAVESHWMAVGAHFDGGSDTGAVYVAQLRASGEAVSIAKVGPGHVALASNANFGFSVCGLGRLTAVHSGVSGGNGGAARCFLRTWRVGGGRRAVGLHGADKAVQRQRKRPRQRLRTRFGCVK